MERLSRGSRRIIALAIWAAGLLMFILLGWWSLNSGSKDSENRLIGEAARAAGEISALLSLAQWELDEHTAGAAIRGALEDERIYAVKITQHNKMLAGQRRNYLWEPVPWDDEITEYSVQGMNPIKINGEAIGRVEVWLSPRLTHEENSLLAWREFWRMLLIVIFWTAALLLLFWEWGDFRRLKKFISRHEEQPEKEKIILGLGNHKTEDVGEQAERGPVNPDEGRRYQRKHPDAWLVTAGMFKQTFAKAPTLMSRLYSEGELAGLCHLGRMLEQAAPCVGAVKLEEAARDMQQCLNDPECKALALPVDQCVSALEEVLDALVDASQWRRSGVGG